VLLPYAALLFIVFTRFRTGDLHTTEFTLRNLEVVLAAPGVQSAIFNTLTVALVVPLACVSIGVVIVYMHERLRLIGSGFAMYLAPAPIAEAGSCSRPGSWSSTSRRRSMPRFGSSRSAWARITSRTPCALPATG
jgi:ABC-type Fe3+ transport system permease subunit